jgi:hypothetical protein
MTAEQDTTSPAPAASSAYARAPETTMETYARHTRNATCFLAAVTAVFIVVGIIMAGLAVHAIDVLAQPASSTNCMSQGGTNPNC